MHIVFIDPAGMQYTVETPYERPLGGSQSAVCYLAIELARLGHSVTVLNGNATTSEGRGVKIDNILRCIRLPFAQVSISVSF
jgi:hypothetical protein